MPYQNMYYEPEKFGCEMVASNDVAESYEFDQIIVVREIATGQLYAAHDSGCSCPTPFEDITGVHDMVPVAGKGGVDAFAREEWANAAWLGQYPGGIEAAIADLVRGVS